MTLEDPPKTFRAAQYVRMSTEHQQYSIQDDMPLAEIAKRLNDQGIRTDYGRPWSYSTVRQVLTNEKYIGNNVYNRHSFKLKKLHVNNPPAMWIRKEGAFEGIVPLDTFLKAQEVLAERTRRYSDEELLGHLKQLYADCGTLSGLIIDQAPGLPCAITYAHRFGSLTRAYELVGFHMTRVTLEDGSRNTRENAHQVAKLLGPRCQQPWLLVTSACHMPRSMAEFKAAGCKVTAYPVDFRTGDSTSLTEYSMAQSLLYWQTALHEWLGLLVYGVTR